MAKQSTKSGATEAPAKKTKEVKEAPAVETLTEASTEVEARVDNVIEEAVSLAEQFIEKSDELVAEQAEETKQMEEVKENMASNKQRLEDLQKSSLELDAKINADTGATKQLVEEELKHIAQVEKEVKEQVKAAPKRRVTFSWNGIMYS